MAELLSPQGRLIGRRITTVVLFVVVGWIALFLANVFDDATVVPGSAGDSRVTTARGAAALFALLDERGLEVTRSGGPLDPPRLSSVVVLEPGYFSDAIQVRVADLVRHLDRGGLVVLGGNFEDEIIEAIAEVPLSSVSTGGDRFAMTRPVAGISGDVVTEGGRGFSRADLDDSWDVLAGDADVAQVVATESGGGVLAVFADVGPFTNTLIDEGVNGPLIAGLLGRYDAVVFDDFIHGYREQIDGESGSWFAAAPPAVRSTLLLLGLVGIAGLVTYGRRLGPPSDSVRRLPPARSAHVRAVGSALGRAGSPTQAVETTRRAALRRLHRLIGPGTTPNDEQLETAAIAAGLDPAQRRAILNGASNAEDILAIDAALASLLAEPARDRPTKIES